MSKSFKSIPIKKVPKEYSQEEQQAILDIYLLDIYLSTERPASMTRQKGPDELEAELAKAREEITKLRKALRVQKEYDELKKEGIVLGQ